MKRNFQNKTVLVTGASGGLGKALCFRYGRAGAHIVGLDLNENALEELAEDLESQNIDALCMPCDVTDPGACEQVIQEAITTFGGIDLVINNAGVTHLAKAQDTPAKKVKQVMEINYMGAVHCTLPALDSLMQRAGMVIAISSVAGFAPLYGRSAYAGSKHALHGFFGTLRGEIKPSGAKVMLVSPSFIDTPIRTRSMGIAVDSENKSQHTTGLHYTPEQVADEIFQASEREKHFLITGVTGKKSYWVNKFFPRLFEKLMVKKMAPAIDQMKQEEAPIPQSLPTP